MKRLKSKPKTLSRDALMAHDPEEWAVLLGMLGFSAKLIARETDLGQFQVYYLLRKRGVSVKDYRDGRNPYAEVLITHTAKLPLKSPVSYRSFKAMALEDRR